MSCSGHVDHAEAELDRGRILTENDEVDGGVQHACLAAEHALKAALASEGEPVPTGSKGHDLSFLASQASMDVPFETVLLTLDGAYNRAALSGHTAPRHHRSGLDTERRRIAHRVHHGEHEPMSEHTIRLAAIRDHLEAVIEDAGIAAELGVVFGSRIRGTATEASDIDVLLVSDDFVGVPGHRRPAPILERWEHARYGAIDVLCYTPEEYREFRERDERTLPDRALAEGVVFVGDPDEHEEYHRRTMNGDNGQ